MSPEYALDGKFSTKSDVFSFGVVMLEIVSGRKNTGFYNPQQVINLLGYVSVITPSIPSFHVFILAKRRQNSSHKLIITLILSALVDRSCILFRHGDCGATTRPST